MRPLLLGALLSRAPSLGPSSAASSLRSAAAAMSAPAEPAPSVAADDEDEEETPAKPTQATPTPSPCSRESGEGRCAPVAPAPALRPRPTATQKLVSGAPLYNPNVAVHIVQKKRFADEGRHEFALFPAAVQVNGKFTQHAGTALSYVYHLQENFGLQVTGQYNWYSNESRFNLELIDKVREQAQAASSLLLTVGRAGGRRGDAALRQVRLLRRPPGAVQRRAQRRRGRRRHAPPHPPEVTNQVDGETFRVPARFGDTGMQVPGLGGRRLPRAVRRLVRAAPGGARPRLHRARGPGGRLQPGRLRGDGGARAPATPLRRRRGSAAAATCQTASTAWTRTTRRTTARTSSSGSDLVAEPSSDVLNNLELLRRLLVPLLMPRSHRHASTARIVARRRWRRWRRSAQDVGRVQPRALRLQRGRLRHRRAALLRGRRAAPRTPSCRARPSTTWRRPSRKKGLPVSAVHLPTPPS